MKKVFLFLAMLGVVSAVHAETDYRALAVIDDIRKGVQNQNTPVTLRATGDVIAGDDVVVTDDITAGGDITASGAISGASVSVSGDSTVTGDLVAEADASVASNLTVTGTSTLTGDVTAEADASVASNLTVTGTSTLTGDVSSEGSIQGGAYIVLGSVTGILDIVDTGVGAVTNSLVCIVDGTTNVVFENLQ